MSDDVASTTGVAGRYASALFDLAKDANGVAAVEAEMKAVKGAIAGSPDFASFIKSPAYDGADQLNVATAFAEKAGFGALSTNFLKLVAKNRRLFAIGSIIDSFLAMAADDRGEISAEAISAAPIDDDHERALRQEIETKLGRAVNLSTRVDPELLGGLVVKIGSQMIDSSLRTKLNKLKLAMKEA